MYVTDNFLEYDGTTIFQEESCNNEVTNHVVVVDGYGVSGEVEYLWVRNSWGSSWGMNNGHFRISMGSLCGINGNDNGDYEVNFVVDVELTDDGTTGSYGTTWSTGTNDNDNDDYAVTADGDGIDVVIYSSAQFVSSSGEDSNSIDSVSGESSESESESIKSSSSDKNDETSSENEDDDNRQNKAIPIIVSFIGIILFTIL